MIRHSGSDFCNSATPASVTFQPFTLARPFTRGTVKISDDRLKPDNAFNFVVSPAQRLPVLILEPPRASREASLYLQRALEYEQAPPDEAWEAIEVFTKK